MRVELVSHHDGWSARVSVRTGAGERASQLGQVRYGSPWLALWHGLREARRLERTRPVPPRLPVPMCRCDTCRDLDAVARGQEASSW